MLLCESTELAFTLILVDHHQISQGRNVEFEARIQVPGLVGRLRTDDEILANEVGELLPGHYSINIYNFCFVIAILQCLITFRLHKLQMSLSITTFIHLLQRYLILIVDFERRSSSIVLGKYRHCVYDTVLKLRVRSSVEHANIYVSLRIDYHTLSFKIVIFLRGVSRHVSALNSKCNCIFTIKIILGIDQGWVVDHWEYFESTFILNQKLA